MDADVSLDCAGLKCPMPVLRAAKALRGMQDGQVLEVMVTDKVAPKDFQTFCREGGHALLATEVLGDTPHGQLVRLRIRRGG
ncbi:sulfurtransferase TusA family protein [Niveispirillum sp. KHB5.9]|uniref:sulfurtransferase TusA family protein n=1 Tax=Niveispirillum sp. KHB5.9 TaxID=3400269 RepID=UPI003A85477D